MGQRWDGLFFVISCHLSGLAAISDPDLYWYHFRIAAKGFRLYRIVDTDPRVHPPCSSHVNKRLLLDFHSQEKKKKKIKASRPGRRSIEVLLVLGWLVFPGSYCCCRGLINDTVKETDRDRVIYSAERGAGGGRKQRGREGDLQGGM